MTILRICCVGDSITLGTEDPEYRGWPGRLCAREAAKGHQISAYNLGIRADTSELVAARWRAECAARLPEVYPAALVFAFGINDTADQVGQGIRVPLERSLAVARSVLTEARAWLPVLFLGPVPVDPAEQPLAVREDVVYDFDNGRIAAANAAYGALCAELEIPFLDLFTPLSALDGWMGLIADGVHPGGVGYDRITDLVEAWAPWRAWMD
ncbi:MAG: hypothetical protein KDE22_10570 [Rhodobacterales bacterium]|nr:hypothetical protein [Rhodobacterales bacterium]